MVASDPALDILRKIVADGVGTGFLDEDIGHVDVQVSFTDDERAFIRDLKAEALGGKARVEDLVRRAITASKAGKPFSVTPAEYGLIRNMTAGEWDAAVLSERREMELLAPVQVVVE